MKSISKIIKRIASDPYTVKHMPRSYFINSLYAYLYPQLTKITNYVFPQIILQFTGCNLELNIWRPNPPRASNTHPTLVLSA